MNDKASKLLWDLLEELKAVDSQVCWMTLECHESDREAVKSVHEKLRHLIEVAAEFNHEVRESIATLLDEAIDDRDDYWMRRRREEDDE